MPMSEAQSKAIAKYSKENYQHISFKARIGSRDRIKEAAEATNQSVNNFIKTAISNAMVEAIGKPLEPSDDEAAKALLLRILIEELDVTLPFDPTERKKIEANLRNVIENEPSLREKFSQVFSSDLTPKDKGKALRKLERKEREAIRDVITDLMYNR